MNDGLQTKRAVNFFLNSKGGVGKSHHAVLLLQAYLGAGLPVIAIDADATSATFNSFKGLGVRRVNLMEDDAINARVFDDITEEFLMKDSNFVIDTGASSFVELSRYLLKNNVPDHVAAAGKRFVANIIVTGGSTFIETSGNLEAIVEQLPPPTEVVVWLNDHFGPVTAPGKEFKDLAVYQRAKDRIKAVVRIIDHTFTEKDTFGVDVKNMMSQGLSFAEVRQSPDFTLMAKARLHAMEKDINGKLAPVLSI